RRRFTVTLQRAAVSRQQGGSASSVRLAQASTLPVMTEISAIRSLTPEEAARAYPVIVIAVLTSVQALQDCYFLQMGSEGIYVDATNQQLTELRPGQQVR